MNNELNNELKAARSFNDVVKVVNKYYDLDAPLGVAGKAMITGSLSTILKAISAKEKVKK
jgi:hypothetical protein